MAERTALYNPPGKPTLEVNGIDLARVDGDEIAELRDAVSAESLAVFSAWMQTHGGRHALQE